MDAVRRRGDEAVREYTQRFDRAEFSKPCVPIQVLQLGSATPDLLAVHACQAHASLGTMQDMPEPHLDDEARQAFDVAFNNISAFHRAQQGDTLSVETMPGVTCRRMSRPIGQTQAPLRCPAPAPPLCAMLLSSPGFLGAACRLAELGRVDAFAARPSSECCSQCRGSGHLCARRYSNSAI